VTEYDPTLDRVISALKEEVRIDPDLDRRVMAEVEGLSPPVRIGLEQAWDTGAPGADGGSRRLQWLRRSRMIRLSPLGMLAAAATLVLAVLGAIRFFAPQPSSVATLAAEGESGATLVADASPIRPTQFVLVAPGAESVAVVGDFNDWNFSATPLARQPGDGVWFVTLPLRPGRYRYAFVVNGTNWRSDPSAPPAEDEFGRPNSVVTIGGA
jgi:hypothetical protein